MPHRQLLTMSMTCLLAVLVVACGRSGFVPTTPEPAASLTFKLFALPFPGQTYTILLLGATTTYPNNPPGAQGNSEVWDLELMVGPGDMPYDTYTFPTKTGLQTGTWILNARVYASGAQEILYLEASCPLPQELYGGVNNTVTWNADTQTCIAALGASFPHAP
jgi:hypothetical protein